MAAGRPGRRGDPTLLVVVNKIDRVGGDGVLTHLTAVSDVIAGLDREAGSRPIPVEYFPVSATTGEGVEALVDAVVARMPEGPRYYPEGMVTDVAEAFWVADLVREELLAPGARTSCPTASPVGSPSGSGPGSGARSWSSATRRRGSSSARRGATLKEVGTAVREPDAARGLPRALRPGGEALAAPRGRPRPPRASESPGADRRPAAVVSSSAMPARKSTTSARSTCPLHRRHPGQQGAAVAGGGQAAVEHRHHPPVAGPSGSAGRPPGPAGSRPGGGRPSRRPRRRPGRAGPEHRVVGPRERDPVDGHQAEGPARARPPPARTRGWRTGRPTRRRGRPRPGPAWAGRTGPGAGRAGAAGRASTAAVMARQLVNRASVRPPAAVISASSSSWMAGSDSGRRRSGRDCGHVEQGVLPVVEGAADVELVGLVGGEPQALGQSRWGRWPRSARR